MEEEADVPEVMVGGRPVRLPSEGCKFTVYPRIIFFRYDVVAVLLERTYSAAVLAQRRQGSIKPVDIAQHLTL